MNRSTSHYTFHGLGVAISGEPTVSAVLHSRLRQLPMNGEGSLDLTFEFCCVPNGENHLVEKPQGRARSVYKSSLTEIAYFDDEDQLYLSYRNQIRVLCNLSEGRVRLSIIQSEIDQQWLISHPLFTIPLVELLKRRERYSLHAAGLCVNGRGLLLAGESGAGKSTLTIALLRAGFGFLGDDMIFLAPGQQGIRALAFPDEIDVTDATACLFPELHYLLNRSNSPGWPKRRVRAEEVYGTDPVWECRPAVIVFPRVAYSEKSVLKPMKREEALLELVPNVLLTEARSSQAHLDVLAELVRESACYRLETGRDFDAIPLLLRGLVE